MVSAYVLVSVEPGKNEQVISGLRTVRGVKQAHTCWGKPDIFAFVETDSEKALATMVLTDIQRIPGVRDTETHIVVPI